MSDVNLSKVERARRVSAAVVAGVIVVWAGLEVLEQYSRVTPAAQFGKAALEERDDTVALEKARRFRVFREAVRGMDRAGFVADPSTESIIDRMLIQSIVAPTLVTDPKLPERPSVLIASFPDEAALDAYLARHTELFPRSRLGAGLAVLERKPSS